jgi:hypothetical protein
MGIFSDVTKLVPGGQAVIEQVPGADAYVVTLANLQGSFSTMGVQSAVFLILTLASLLFLRHNR